MAFTPASANIRASVSARHRPASVIRTCALMPPARLAWRTTNTVRAGSAACARRPTASSAGRRSLRIEVGFIGASILQAASGVDEGRSQLTRGQGRKTVSNAGESPRRILTPLRGWGFQERSPTAYAVGYYLAPLRGWAGESPRRILTPLRGWGFQERFPTAYAVGYYLAPLRGWAGESLEHRGICLPAFFMNFRGPQALYNRRRKWRGPPGLRVFAYSNSQPRNRCWCSAMSTRLPRNRTPSISKRVRCSSPASYFSLISPPAPTMRCQGSALPSLPSNCAT